jgi:hypothetical protein
VKEVEETAGWLLDLERRLEKKAVASDEWLVARKKQWQVTNGEKKVDPSPAYVGSG